MRVKKSAWGGILEWEEDDTPRDVQYFNATGKALVLWRQQSVSLYWAARYLVDEKPGLKDEDRREENAPAALMLGGYALETLFKMVIVADHCLTHGFSLSSRRADEFLPKIHNLEKLIKAAKIRCNARDREILRKLSEYSVWAGRYPIPMNAQGFSGSAFSRLVAPLRGEKSQLSILQQGFVPLYEKVYPIARRRAFGPSARKRGTRITPSK